MAKETEIKDETKENTQIINPDDIQEATKEMLSNNKGEEGK